MLTQTEDTMQILEDIAGAHGEHEAAVLLVGIRRMELRNQIRRGREAGLTLAQIAELLGMSRQRVDQLSKG